jgi:hypothetical protein
VQVEEARGVQGVLNPNTKISLDDMLAAVPVQNRSAECAKDTENELHLRVPLRRRWYMSAPFSWAFPFRTHRGFSLDRLGREVWKACDGTRCVEEIVETFASKHHLSFHEARTAVSEFLKSLTQRGLIVIVGKPGERTR